ncbi:hypothetical protein SOM61_19185 [Massilia sp. CFBP9012]|uniref:hypothetical protein n=1 Tax=Massilia sp. CFBP9012 TaxID=3096531 RepID=UPI002A6A1545|nr:hypothetical protein [Massilia sp. CFBP9012]MDY0977093.1 hypothetical protein [Massilia sp. CFBP9012]
MTLTGGIVTVRGIRLALVFTPPDCLRTGAGDALLARLGPWFPRLPVMLAAPRAHPTLAYAQFDAHALLPELDLADMVEREIDLDGPPPDDSTLPF